MDDLVLFADEKDTLWDTAVGVERFLQNKLHLKIKRADLLLAPVS
jgi:hypothetical protein